MAVVLDVVATELCYSLHDGEINTYTQIQGGASYSEIPSTMTLTLWFESEGLPMGEYFWPVQIAFNNNLTGCGGYLAKNGDVWTLIYSGVTATTVTNELGTWQAVTLTVEPSALFGGNVPSAGTPFDIQVFIGPAFGWDNSYVGAIDFSAMFGITVVGNTAEPEPQPMAYGLLSAADLASMRSIQALALPDSIELLELNSNQNALGEEEAPASYTVINTVPGRLAVDSVTHPFDAGRTVQTDDYILTFANDVDLSGVNAFRVFDDVYVPFGEVDNRGRSWRTAQRIKVRRSDLQADPSVA